MANYNISPNMTITTPVPSVDPGPEWATLIYNALYTTVDSHNHSSGQGVQIGVNGLNIQNSLPLNNNFLTLVGGVTFNNSATNNTGTIYSSGGELYYNDLAGNKVEITKSGNVNAGAGSITGLVSPASASYSSNTFLFQSGTNTAANIDAGAYNFRNPLTNSNAVTLQAPNGNTAYTLTLPTIPSAISLVTIDTSGNIGSSLESNWINTTGGQTIAGNLTVNGNLTFGGTISTPKSITFTAPYGPTAPTGNGQGSISAGSTSANGLALIGQGSTNDIIFYNKNGTPVLLVPTGTEAVDTANNTLDDGSGNMTIAGNFTSNGTSTNVFKGQINITPAFATSANGNELLLYTDSGQSAYTTLSSYGSTYSGGSAGNVGANGFVINSSGNAAVNLPVGKFFSVAVNSTSFVNVLNDGSGNATFTGHVVADGNITAEGVFIGNGSSLTNLTNANLVASGAGIIGANIANDTITKANLVAEEISITAAPTYTNSTTTFTAITSTFSVVSSQTGRPIVVMLSPSSIYPTSSSTPASAYTTTGNNVSIQLQRNGGTVVCYWNLTPYFSSLSIVYVDIDTVAGQTYTYQFSGKVNATPQELVIDYYSGIAYEL